MRTDLFASEPISELQNLNSFAVIWKLRNSLERKKLFGLWGFGKGAEEDLLLGLISFFNREPPPPRKPEKGQSHIRKKNYLRSFSQKRCKVAEKREGTKKTKKAQR